MARPPLQPSSIRNHLLTTLSPEILLPLLSKFSAVKLSIRQVLHAAEAPIETIYFPETGMVSLVAGMEEAGKARSASSVGRA